jgi:hypothetical protein
MIRRNPVSHRLASFVTLMNMNRRDDGRSSRRFERVPSPGPWPAPLGVRAGSDWLPPGGISERTDRLSLWRRVWLRVAHSSHQRAEWLWFHGGYDVETRVAAAEREQHVAEQLELQRIARMAIDLPEPWPIAVNETDNTQVLDVDRYDNAAAVLARTNDNEHGSLLHSLVFFADGIDWRYAGGAGGGGQAPVEHLAVGTLGSLSVHAEHGRSDRICHGAVRVSAEATTVVVDRVGGPRTFRVAGAAVWFAVLWRPGSQPTVRALDGDGTELAVLTATNFNLFRRGRRP